jgi:hypothetical protein
MLSIGLWWWYINITITILDIIRRLVLYLKLNSTLQVCPYLTGNTLRLRYDPNRLMLSIGLWRWYITITITILDIIHNPVYYLKHKISETGFCLLLQMEPTHLVPVDRAGPRCLRTETSSCYRAHLCRFHLQTGRESSLRNVVLDNVQNFDSYSYIYHRLCRLLHIVQSLFFVTVKTYIRLRTVLNLWCLLHSVGVLGPLRESVLTPTYIVTRKLASGHPVRDLLWATVNRNYSVHRPLACRDSWEVSAH